MISFQYLQNNSIVLDFKMFLTFFRSLRRLDFEDSIILTVFGFVVGSIFSFIVVFRAIKINKIENLFPCLTTQNPKFIKTHVKSCFISKFYSTSFKVCLGKTILLIFFLTAFFGRSKQNGDKYLTSKSLCVTL